MSKSIKGFQPPTPEEIAICAHSIYEKEGRPNGRETQHWLQAEAQLIAERKAQAGQSPAKAREKPANNNIMPAPNRNRQTSLHRN